MPLDAVCGKAVPVKGTSPRAVFHGQSYYFCSRACEAKFRAQPQRYAHPAGAPSRAPRGART